MTLLLQQIALIVTVGAGIGLVVNLAHPRGVALTVPLHSAAESGAGTCETEVAHVRSIAAEEANALCGDCNVAFVDARGGATFAQGHIAGAVHLPPQRDAHARSAVALLREKRTVIVYGDNTRCDQAQSVAQRLIEDGHTGVRILEGGWPAWSDMSRPAVSGPCDKCLELAHP